eukprot:469956_1
MSGINEQIKDIADIEIYSIHLDITMDTSCAEYWYDEELSDFIGCMIKHIDKYKCIEMIKIDAYGYDPYSQSGLNCTMSSLYELCTICNNVEKIEIDEYVFDEYYIDIICDTETFEAFVQSFYSKNSVQYLVIDINNLFSLFPSEISGEKFIINEYQYIDMDALLDDSDELSLNDEEDKILDDYWLYHATKCLYQQMINNNQYYKSIHLLLQELIQVPQIIINVIVDEYIKTNTFGLQYRGDVFYIQLENDKVSVYKKKY